MAVFNGLVSEGRGRQDMFRKWSLQVQRRPDDPMLMPPALEGRHLRLHDGPEAVQGRDDGSDLLREGELRVRAVRVPRGIRGKVLPARKGTQVILQWSLISWVLLT